MGAEHTEQRRRFVPPPGYTQIPHELLDEVMPAVSSLAELKVTLAIARETFGWGRENRLLSLTQLQELTGLSRQSAQAGVKLALDRGYVGRRRVGHGFLYGLGVKNVDSKPSSEESTSLPSKSLDSRPPSIEGNKALRGKETQPGADAPSTDKQAGRRRRGKQPDAGRPFQPDPDDPADVVVVELFDFWIANTTQPDGAVFTNKRAGQARARLREQAEGCDRDSALAVARTRMLEAMEGWVHSDWHRRQQAFDWETLFRSRSKVDMFRGRRQKETVGAESNPEFAAYNDQIERES